MATQQITLDEFGSARSWKRYPTDDKNVILIRLP